MKKGEKPQLDYQWWSKNKAKTLTKTGLGAALREYGVALDRFKWAEALKALVKVEKAVKNAINKASPSTHKETIATLRLFLGASGVIKKEETRLAQKAKEKGGKSGTGVAPLKQKKLGPNVLWQRDIGIEFMKKFGKNHEWIKSLKGGDVRLALDKSILVAIEAEGEQVLAMRMVDQCNKIFNQSLLPELETALNKLEKKTVDADLPNAMLHALAGIEKNYRPKFERVPLDVWKSFIAKKQQYKDYKVDTGFEIAITGLKVVGSGLAIAAAVPTGGAGLALGIYGGVQSAGASARLARDVYQEAETVLKRLEKNMISLEKDWSKAKKKALSTAKSLGSTFADTILNYPVFPTVSICEKDHKLAGDKVAGLDVKHVKLGKDVTKVLKDLDKMETMLKKGDKKRVAKAYKDLTKLRASMMKILDQTHDMGKRVDDTKKALRKMDKLMAELKKGTPGYITGFEKYFPIAHNLIMACANAGVGFAAAASALESANAGIGLANDLLTEVKDQLS